MRYFHGPKGLCTVLVLLLPAASSRGHRNEEQALIVQPSHRSRVHFNRAAPGPVAPAIENGYAFPAAYNFGSSEPTTATSDAYHLPTVSEDGDKPSLTASSVSVKRPSTATPEPRSPVSDGPEREATSSVTVQQSSKGEMKSSRISPITQVSNDGSTDPSSVTSPFSGLSQDAASQTDDHRDETVTVTVTNFISSLPRPTETESSSVLSNVDASTKMSTSSGVSDIDVTIVTITSLHTITLSIGHSASPAQPTASAANSTSALGTVSNPASTSTATNSSSSSSSGASIITITRTETWTGIPNSTSKSANEATSKDIATSTINMSDLNSHIPPFSASFNLSSGPGPSVSSLVSGAVTSLHPSPSITTHTVFQNITLTLSEVPQTESRETAATRTAVPTYPTSSNSTGPASSADGLTTLYPLPTSAPGLNTTQSTATVNVTEASVVGITTMVVTITVYPTSLRTLPTNETSATTPPTNSSTSTMISPPYPSGNANVTVLTTADLTVASDGPRTSGSAGGWTTGGSTASMNSTVIGTLVNTTTSGLATEIPHATSVDTTCEHASVTTGSAITGTAYSSASLGADTNARPRTTKAPQFIHHPRERDCLAALAILGEEAGRFIAFKNGATFNAHLYSIQRDVQSTLVGEEVFKLSHVRSQGTLIAGPINTQPLALAAVATAFVIIPEISEHDESIFKILPIDHSDSAFAYDVPESAFGQSVSVPCSDCKGRNTRLRLDFTVEDDTKLLLNGFELYPDADPWSGDLQAAVIKGHRQPKNQKLGYSLAVYPKATAKEDNMELIEVDLKIIEVGTRFVDGVPAVRVDLIKAPGGSIAMSTVTFDQPLETACTTIWCRARELADKVWAQIHEMKGCGKSATSEPDSEAEYVDLADADIPDMEFIPEIDEPVMPSREEWHRLVKSIAGHIIMPIVMGVTAGVSVAFLALCIQSMARRLGSIIRGKRDGEAHGDSHKVSHREQATADEKVQLMA
ncbi:hypothetical protein NLG97_g4049 [Lecanicillium saksenae]|uniref:Uncharacterized protein n=1 Tax=Lecanicillium saksenae TaxID=468837 RepID=A0ACC1QZ01_9HYPO|nr:hypothetical protein NLG97_g4049 [Lecanicillium saksenae]